MHAFFMAGSYSFVTTVTGRRLPSISACPTNFSLSCVAEHYSEEFEGRAGDRNKLKVCRTFEPCVWLVAFEEFEGRKGHTRQAKEALAKLKSPKRKFGDCSSPF